MGCLLAGCCFGKETGGHVGLVFPADSPASEWQSKHGVLASRFMRSHPVHPTQLYESAAALVIAAICLFYVQGRKRYDGQVFLSFIVLYAAARFVIELFRSDDRGALFGLTTSQLIGVGLIGAALVAHRRFGAKVQLA
jgi:phosphatidylglycerol:prolipoprotein diacylglycerol transferase